MIIGNVHTVRPEEHRALEIPRFSGLGVVGCAQISRIAGPGLLGWLGEGSIVISEEPRLFQEFDSTVQPMRAMLDSGPYFAW